MYTTKSGFSPVDFNPKTFITVPNIVTITRLLILPFILILLFQNKNIWAFLLIIFAGLTDILDGFLAKILNQATAVGKIIDPFVDKIFALTIFVFLLFYRNFPLWAFITILLFEILILTGGYILAIKFRIVPSSNIYGKIAASFISVSIWLYVIDINFFKRDISLKISLQKIVLILGIVMLFFAIISYAIRANAKIKKFN
ncbi:MAG: CDP-alcohol phosphatidyltransferase family protein [Candidatus Cloacimonetes bacterium]|nr:CDP-alcohol phosphatidyltransferase family protein [Candidatus Cloacimonadota bacterium]MBL7085563.1 CDP-alcohol phosphatidyltransferase family protein [Candidatus Cloacimonadota bacterium]